MFIAALLVGIITTLLIVFAIHLIAMIPALGPALLRRLLEVRLLLVNVVLFCAAVVWFDGHETAAIAMLACAAFATLAAVLIRGETVFATLDETRRVRPDDAGLSDSTIVLGLTEGGESVCWPLWEVVAPRHIVHEVVGGRPLIVTYCPACRTGVAFDRVLHGKTLQFSVAGLWRKNMVLVDRAGRSLWQQASGACINGPHKGAQLDMLFVEQCTLGAWRKDHPETTVGLPPEGAQHSIFAGATAIAALRDLPRKIAPAGVNPKDDRLAPHEEVVGIVIDQTSWAVPLARVSATVDGVAATVGGRQVNVTYSADAARVRVTVNGAPHRFSREWWLAWSEYHPGTHLHAA